MRILRLQTTRYSSLRVIARPNLVLAVSASLLLGTQVGLTATAAQTPSGPETARVQLFFVRQATKLKGILDSITKDLVVQVVDENQLALYGEHSKVEDAKRFLAMVDLPLPSVQMEIWGVQISSGNPKSMNRVLVDIQSDLNAARSALRDTYAQMQLLAGAIPSDLEFTRLLTGKVPLSDADRPSLGYEGALDSNPDHSLSITDILIRLAAADHYQSANEGFANDLTKWLEYRYKPYVDALRRRKGEPFGRLFGGRGLRRESGIWLAGPDPQNPSVDRLRTYTRQARSTLLQFAYQYADTIERPSGFSPFYLQYTASNLNDRMQLAVDALIQDIFDLFIVPTLERIRIAVERFSDVEYAQVGKTSVASLSGILTQVSGSSVSAFDVTPPLRLSELLQKASDLQSKIAPFIPKGPEGAAAGAAANLVEPTVSGIPYSQLLGLLAAFGEERSVWRELSQGVSLDVTPNVLRNAASAELSIHLTIGDPQASTRETGVRPISRVSKHEVKNTVYVNALDIFDLSTFSSEATLNGGRGYFPIVGTIWEGLFGDVPVLGSLFSWKKSPKHVYSQSILLTNTLINPTAMGVALLHPHRHSASKALGGWDADGRIYTAIRAYSGP